MASWSKGFLASATAALLFSGVLRATGVTGPLLFLAYIWLAISLVGAACVYFELSALRQANQALVSIFALCLTFLIDTLFGGVLLHGTWMLAIVLAGGSALCLLAVYRFGKRGSRA